MRSFLIALLSFSLPLSILASHGDHRARRHSEIALRARGDILPRAQFDAVRATYYQIDVGPVACGGNYKNSDFVVALSIGDFSGPFPSYPCFKTITITCLGKTATAQIVDKCGSCPHAGLDLTEALFNYFTNGDLGKGVISCDWSYEGQGNPAPAPAPAPATTSQPPPPPQTTYTPPPPPPPTSTSTYTPPPPTSTSTPAPAQTTSSSTTTSITSTSSKPSAAASTSSSGNSSVGSASGLAQPQITGSTVPDGQKDNIFDLNQVFQNMADLVEACNPT
ncbi:hypothetical protein BGW80DRAFT_1287483 [Lactifluus volemus]|nr:hypothetical protein BGW80DRAFT_1287483 [Lactifluus volemus]